MIISKNCKASQNQTRYIRVIMVALLAVAIAACQASSGVDSRLVDPSPKTVQLSFQLAEVNGDQLVCTVNAKSVHPIFQLSTRVMFDPLAVKPLSIERGDLVGQQAVFFALDNQPGFVPLAFTYHQGDQISGNSGELAHIEFEVLDASRPANIRFDENEEYLIARDAGGNNLPVELAVVK